MYAQLLEVWKEELDGTELVKLPPDFYARIIAYARKLKEESRMLDKRTVRANILKKESDNMKRMVQELTWARYKKIIDKAARGEEIASETLTAEEKQMYDKISPPSERVANFILEILHGHEPSITHGMNFRRVVLRLLKDIPAIVGADMKTYGPFKTEDIASLPIENGRVLIKQKMAEKVGSESATTNARFLSTSLS